MEDKYISQELVQIKESLSALVKALNENLENMQNAVSWKVGKHEIHLVSREKSIDELLALAKFSLETYRDK